MITNYKWSKHTNIKSGTDTKKQGTNTYVRVVHKETVLGADSLQQDTLDTAVTDDIEDKTKDPKL